MTGRTDIIAASSAALPALGGLEEDAARALGSTGRIVDIPAGQVVFRPGSEAETYLIVLKGSVRVSLTGQSGREIVLYRVERGHSCVLTTSCLMTGSSYEAEGVTESDVQALIIPRACYYQLLGQSEKFRRLVFSAFAERLHDLIVLINEVAFGQLDVRLAGYLLEHGQAGPVAKTHQVIASDLGSAREAVSRLLKDFEHKGLVRLDRGRVTLSDTAGLEAMVR